MLTVAIAGGTGHIGLTLVEAIQAIGKYKLIILSRQSYQQLEASIGTRIVVVDYAAVDDLTRVLEDNNVHTVVSALTMFSDSGDQTSAEMSLIRAADASKVTQRIISSDWGFPHTQEHLGVLSSVKAKLDAQKLLHSTRNLESTVVQNGYFMDYWGMPGVKSYMPPSTSIVDIPNATAGIPGNGDVPVIFSHTTDVARFTAALLDSDGWNPVSYVVGDKMTWNEFLHLAEQIKGVKFNVTYDSIEKLKNGQVTELPGHSAIYPYFPKEELQPLLAKMALLMAEGAFNYQTPITLNSKFPELKAMRVEDMLRQAWA